MQLEAPNLKVEASSVIVYLVDYVQNLETICIRAKNIPAKIMKKMRIRWWSMEMIQRKMVMPKTILRTIVTGRWQRGYKDVPQRLLDWNQLDASPPEDNQGGGDSHYSDNDEIDATGFYEEDFLATCKSHRFYEDDWQTCKEP